jgi:hypothetical protein
MLDIIAPASMLAKDKHFASHTEWIRNLSAKMAASGDLEKAWDGGVHGEPVKACIDSSRWVAFCPYCASAEAVDPVEKVFFCFHCNMLENDYQALPVEFPEAGLQAQVIAALMERPMIQRGGPTRYERITRMLPVIFLDMNGQRFGLGRSWHFSQTIEDLRAEQDEAIRAWKEGQK